MIEFLKFIEEWHMYKLAQNLLTFWAYFLSRSKDSVVVIGNYIFRFNRITQKNILPCLIFIRLIPDISFLGHPHMQTNMPYAALLHSRPISTLVTLVACSALFDVYALRARNLIITFCGFNLYGCLGFIGWWKKN